MTEPRPRLTCPKCGDEMNHHAEKVVYPADEPATAHVDPAFGGIVHEAHACPRCGNIELRAAGEDLKK